MSIVSPSSPLFQAFVSITIFTFVFSSGMSLSIAQLRAFWQQRRFLIRTLVATVILTVDLPKPVPLALALLMAAPSPPLLTQRISKAGVSLEVVFKVFFLILVIFLLILLISSNLLSDFGWVALLAIALFNVLLLAIGHFLARGYETQSQGSVAVSAIARNLRLTIFINTSLARVDAILTILMAQIIGIIINLPYTQYMKQNI